MTQIRDKSEAKWVKEECNWGRSEKTEKKLQNWDETVGKF